jgi:hypothetical protein
LEGCELEKSEPSAYYWLRMMEQNSVQVQQRSRILIEKLKACMKPQEIETIERRLTNGVESNKPLVVSKPLVELVRESVNLLSRTAV